MVAAANENPYSTFALTLDGQNLEIFGRAGNKYTLIDLRTGQFLDTGFKTVPSSAGFATMRSLYDLGSWKPRDVLVISQNFGLAGFAIDPLASISKYDTSRLMSCYIMGDSYTQLVCTQHTLGPVGEALLYTVRPGFGPMIHTSSGSGSGQLSGGNSNRNFRDTQRFGRFKTALQQQQSDAVCGLHGINDGPTNSVAENIEFFQGVRSVAPNSVILWAASQTPRNAYVPNSTLQAGFIKTALLSIPGPWVFVNLVDGSWTNSSGKTDRFARAPVIFGTGKADDPKGDGNSDWNTHADGVHTTTPGTVVGRLGGAEYLGGVIHNGWREAILAL